MDASELDFTEDRLLGGRILLRQPRHGFRANLDTVLLAAAVGAGARLLEAGCGAGGALLAVAFRQPEAFLLGVERDAAMAELARANVAANGAHAEIVTGDIQDRACVTGGFDGVFFNPPFYKPGEGHAPAPARLGARTADASLECWVKALVDRLRGGGTMTLIHRTEALGEALAALEGRLGAVTILPVHPREGMAAKRVLVRASKGSRAPLRLLPGLILHQGEQYTRYVRAILEGEAEISWD